MSVITRFAPSPTGFLHIGGARTALFNYLFSKHHGGKFLLRIEDTDKERSTKEATEAILNGMKWLGLEYDGEPFYQSQHDKRHADIAEELLANDKAYKCYATTEEIEEFRKENPYGKFQSPWRDKTPDEAPEGVEAAIRLKAPREGETIIDDLVQGEVKVSNSELDDMILLRSDGTPTYMLAVVVDDHDMGITHVIRGDDHLTNAFRQKLLYDAMGWDVPKFAHIPLIHGQDGAKLSKRHGALGVEAYDEMGYLPEGLLNYLLKLGWSHGDDEIIPLEKAIEWFDADGIGKAAARFDTDKLNHINSHYINEKDPQELLQDICNRIQVPEVSKSRILEGMEGIKSRADTLIQLAEVAKIYIEKRKELDEKSKETLANGGIELLKELKPLLESISNWDKDTISSDCKQFAKDKGLKPPQVMMALRAGVLGTFTAPGIFEVMAILGKKEVLARLEQ